MFNRILRSKSLKARVRWIMGGLLVMTATSLVISFQWQGGGAKPGPGGAAGVIFGRQIPWEVFQQEYRLIHRHLEEQAGRIPANLEPFVRQQTWDRLILQAEARRRVRVSDQDVARHLHRQPLFQRDGWFSKDLYFQVVRGLGLSPQAFEDRIRDDLRIQKLLDSVTAPVTVSEEELRTAYAKEYERVRAVLSLVETTAFDQEAARGLTKDEARRYYAAHQETVRQPAKRLIHYLGLSGADAVTAQQQRPLTDDAIQTFADTHEELLKQPDGSVPPAAQVREETLKRLRQDEARKALKNLALDLDDDREAGLRFEEIAATRQLGLHSVGPFERGAPGIPNGPTASMLEAAFETRLGQMTQVFESPEGVFVLTPREEIPSRIPPFEDVADTMMRRMAAERSREAAGRQARQLREALLAQRADGLTVEETFLRLNMAPERPAPFTRHDPLGSFGRASDTIESLFQAKPGDCSVLETPGGFVLGCLEERLPFDPAQFATERERFHATLLESKRHERADDWLMSLRKLARLKSFLDELPQGAAESPSDPTKQ
ncbi:MAG: SurA N-terminal domain-containing protein [Candidatus Omnitrophica bacterium]|nr:SurA N-terminal domain-containing protein [Candidatus Omnitrophota bacterium]